LSGNICSTAASTIHKSASVSSIAKPQLATGWHDVSFKSRNGGIKKRAGAVFSPKMAKKVATDMPAKISANCFQVLSDDEDMVVGEASSSDDDEPCSSNTALKRAARKAGPKQQLKGAHRTVPAAPKSSRHSKVPRMMFPNVVNFTAFRSELDVLYN